MPAKPGTVRLVAAALFFLTLALFWGATRNDFVNYDDPDYVTANEHVKAGLTLDGVKWALRSGEAANWHPLTWMSHQLDATLYGENARGHHTTSVVIHALNAAMAFLAIRRLTGALWLSAMFAALFAWHPLRVESVAWVAERKDVLSGFFWFVVLWAYAGYAERRRDPARPDGRWRRYLLAWVAFGLGLMAKPMLVTLPCVLLLLDVWPLRRMSWMGTEKAEKGETPGWLVLEKLPFLALSLGSSIATYLVQKSGGAVSSALDLPSRLGNAVVAVVRYLGKLAWPFDLAVLYPHPGTWPGGKVVACIVIVVTLTAIAVGQVRRRPWLAVGWFWFIGTLVPVAGIVQVGIQSMADRYTYIPLLGVQLAVLWLISSRLRTAMARQIWGTVAGCVLVACAIRTVGQIGVWKNSLTLFDHAIAVTENNYLAHDNRGLFLFKAGRIPEALADYQRALAINPGYFNANNNLGHALSQLGRPAEAVPLFRAALKANPAHLEVHNNLANALSDLNQLPEAMEHYDYVLARAPNHVNALNGSAVAFAMQGRLAEARARLEKSLQLAPANASALSNLGNVYSMLGRTEDALQSYRRVSELNPSDAQSLVMIGTLLNQQQKFAEAASALQRATSLNPNHPEAHAQLGFAWLRLGRRDDALRELRATLQLQPSHASAAAWLAQLQAAR